MAKRYTVRNFHKDGTEIHDLSKVVIPKEIVGRIHAIFIHRYEKQAEGEDDRERKFVGNQQRYRLKEEAK